MADTHGVAGQGWYGFDLDGTLAAYTKWQGIDHIGEPVKPMVDLIKKLHAGKFVKIVTARVAPRAQPETPVANVYYGKPEPWTRDVFMNMFDRKADALEFAGMYAAETWGPREFVIDWCVNYLGFVPEITHEKDHLMVTLYDDRVKQVVPNNGALFEDIASRMYELHKEEHEKLGWAYARASSKFLTFINGMLVGGLLAILAASGIAVYEAWQGRKDPVYQRTEAVIKAAQALLEVLPAQEVAK